MGYIDVAGMEHTLPDGRELFTDVSFRVGEGAKVALVGPNGAGKTTLLRMITGDLPIQEGAVARSGGLGVMRQFIGMIADERTLQRSGPVRLAAPAVRAAGERLPEAERAMQAAEATTAPAGGPEGAAALRRRAGHLGRGRRLRRRGAVRHGQRHRRSTCLGDGPEPAGADPVRRAAEAVRARAAAAWPDKVLLVDEPDNFLDVPAKRWLEGRLRESDKRVLYVSHDRELLAQTETRVVTVEGGTHGSIRGVSRVGTRPARPGTSGWTSCAGAGTRSARRSANWS